MAKMHISKLLSQRLRLQATSQRLRIVAEVVLGSFIGQGMNLIHTATATDLLSFILAKLAADSVGTTDQANFAIAKGLNDLAGVTDSTSFDVSKPAVDLFAANDEAAISTGKIAEDTFSMTDNAFFGIGRNPADTVSFNELLSFDAGKTLSDYSIASDVVGLSLAKSFADTVAMTDSVEALLSTLQSATDASSILDQQVLLIGKGATDSASAIDEQLFVVGKLFHEAPVAIDTLGVNLTKVLLDAVAMSDTLSALLTREQAASDSSVLTDTNVLLAGKNPEDVVGTIDTQAFAVAKAITDTPIASEQIGLSLAKTLFDVVSMTDSLTALLLREQSASDSGAVTDANALTFGKQPQETTITTDTQAFAITKGLNDAVYATDDIGAEATLDDDQTLQFQKRLIDFAGISDSAELEAAFARGFADAGFITDSVNVFLQYARPQVDALSASDSVSISAEYDRQIGDGTTTQDNLVSLVGKVKSDILGVEDSGFLLSQDYIDNNLYFANDYVGEKRTF